MRDIFGLIALLAFVVLLVFVVATVEQARAPDRPAATSSIEGEMGLEVVVTSPKFLLPSAIQLYSTRALGAATVQMKEPYLYSAECQEVTAILKCPRYAGGILRDVASIADSHQPLTEDAGRTGVIPRRQWPPVII